MVLFKWDLVATVFGGVDTAMARVVYTIVGLAAIYCISLLREWLEKLQKNTRINGL